MKYVINEGETLRFDGRQYDAGETVELTAKAARAIPNRILRKVSAAKAPAKVKAPAKTED